ncbi:hypothetical protein NJO91_29780 [Streptomyces microflavus]|uniref:hypothetical protein n=1 Tax=Streptomyces microflavus TaxID=1919 RepID=UPI0029A7E85D|nr:hypothetical protein [Streptomyces microflavus]MDX2407304.1 hypothetical protein [Streptomyces microflavus]
MAQQLLRSRSRGSTGHRVWSGRPQGLPAEFTELRALVHNTDAVGPLTALLTILRELVAELTSMIHAHLAALLAATPLKAQKTRDKPKATSAAPRNSSRPPSTLRTERNSWLPSGTPRGLVAGSCR